jgi:PAS domain S-box-containing protein
MKKKMPIDQATTGEVRMPDLDRQVADPLSAAWTRLYGEAPIGLCHFDTRLRYVHINDWLAALNGLSVAQHLGRTVGEVLPDVAAGVESQLRHVIETGEPIFGGTVDAETPARPGEIRSFRHSFHPVKDDGGTVVGVSCVVEEVTERKRAEDALNDAHKTLERRVRERTAELARANAELQREIAERKQARQALEETEEAKQALFAASEDSIFLLARDGTVLEANQAGAGRFGMTVDDILGKSIYDFMPPELAKSRSQQLARLDAGESVMNQDQREGRWFENRVHPVSFKDGKVERYAVFASDITER